MIAHEWLDKELGVSCKIGWQLDPFGHSSTFGRILSELGYDSVVLGRIDTEEI